MANIKSAKKRNKTNERDRQRNVSRRSKIKTLIRKLETLQEEAELKTLLNTIYAEVDKAPAAVMPTNRASRIKKRMAKLVKAKTAK